MSRGLNKAILIGNVGAAPELRTTSSGRRVATLSLATSRHWLGGAGEEHDRTDWHRIVAWDELATLLERSVRRGDRLFVEGRVEYRSWQDRNRQTRYATEIIAQVVMVLSGGDAESAAPSRTERSRPISLPVAEDATPSRPGEDPDDLPF